jgi:hypothetical protein
MRVEVTFNFKYDVNLVGVGSSSAIFTSNVTKMEGECSIVLKKQLI